MESNSHMKDDRTGIECDSCGSDIPTEVVFYHCHYCNRGNFDLCGDCVDQGVLCGRAEHRLFSRKVEKGELFEDKTPQDLDDQSQSDTEEDSIEGLTADYVYTQLNTDSSSSFRLIELFPGTFSEAVKCFIHEYIIEESPSYEALSYCWGVLTEKLPISCDGYRLLVTSNLTRALRHLRHESEPRLLWVDAICINQADDQERSHQVGLMPNIYKKSMRTVAWLGESSADSDVALAVCERVASSVISGNSPVATIPEVTYWNIHGPLKVVTQESNKPTNEEIAAVARLFKRPWFSRVWILQEVGLSAEVIVKCGNREVDFDILFFGFQIGATVSEQLKVGRPEYLYTANLLSTVRNWNEMHPQFFELPALLERTRRFQSSEPKDKIFALFGLTSTNLEELKLSSDYSSTVVETYTRVSLALLNSSPTLSLLELPLGRTTLSSSLPSWVTDWSDFTMIGSSITERRRPEKSRGQMARTRAYAFLKKLFALNEIQLSDEILSEKSQKLSDLCKSKDAESLSKSHLSIFKTSLGSQLDKPLKIVDGALNLSGKVIDIIRYVGQVAVTPDTDHEDVNKMETLESLYDFIAKVATYLKAILEWEEITCVDKPERYLTGEDRLQVFWQTLCAGFFPGTYEQAKDDFEVWYAKFRDPRFVAAVKAFDRSSPDTCSAFVDALRNIKENIRNAHIFASMSEPTLERRLARTEKGYVGLVPAQTEVNDVVAILKGGQLPFVLRPREGRWQLIGGSYIHGIMNGEAFDERLCGEIRLI